MRRDEVPQDPVAHYAKVRKAIYAVDERGGYGTVVSSGWQVEALATNDAVAEFERLASAARARVEAGEASPLEYHMYARRMDLPTLAQSTGLWRWRVRRHLKPRVFARLSPDLLQRHADALGISVDELTRLP